VVVAAENPLVLEPGKTPRTLALNATDGKVLRVRAPAGATLWGTMNRPRRPPTRANPIRTVLALDGHREIAIDLTGVLSSPGSTWVQFDSLGGVATVKVGGKPVATLAIPDEL
jgi:hypothetical protein